eukprot:Hpha_TRINITY_DN9295_c0_g2::TRINITY_DN9295_c0_g2_i1::g.28548::m.28548
MHGGGAPFERGRDVATAAFGLNRHATSPAAPALLRAVVRRVSPAVRFERGAQVSMALYAVRNWECSPTSREFLSLVASRTSAGTRMTSREIGTSLYGIRLQRPQSAQGILLMLTPVVNAHTGEMSLQDICMSVYGLQRMGGTMAGTKMLSLLAAKMHNAEGVATAEQFSCALFGLQRFSGSDVLEDVVTTLRSHAATLCDEFEPLGMAMALYGMQRFAGNRSGEGPRLFAQIVPRVSARRGGFTSETLGMALYGLHSCSDSPLVRSLLNVLAEAAREVPQDTVHASHIASALYGIRSVGDAEGTRG